jgi:hypothetical protein
MQLGLKKHGRLTTKRKKSQQGHIAVVILRNQYHVEREADTFRVWSVTKRGADFGQIVKGEIVRYLGNALQGQTVTVPEAESALLNSGLSLPYNYGYKLHFFAQNALVALVATGNASHRRVGQGFEYNIA